LVDGVLVPACACRPIMLRRGDGAAPLSYEVASATHRIDELDQRGARSLAVDPKALLAAIDDNEGPAIEAAISIRATERLTT
jgi:hypothetical protein